MIKGVLKRIFVQLMTLVLVLTSITLMEPIGVAEAATEVAGLADQSIGLSHDGVDNDSWTANETTITGTATGTKGSCGGSDKATTTTLVIQNKKESDAMLSFDIEKNLNGGSFKIDDKEYTEGIFSQVIPGGGIITLTLESPAGKVTSTVSLSNVLLKEITGANVTFHSPEYGTYTVDGYNVTAEFTKNKAAGESYVLNVTSVNSGYKFVGWYQNGIFLSENGTYELTAVGESSIEAKFLDLSAPSLSVGGKRFFDWQEAIDAASTGNDKTIIVLKDSVINEGETYTIPSGVTLLVPFDDKHTCYTTKPEADTAYIIGREYCCLKIEGTLNVSTGGVISVSAKHRAGQGSPAGMVTGDYGHIVLGKNGLINLEEGASLYAYGYISGSGMVQAKSGSQVFEYFQMIDYRGGSVTSNMLNNSEKVFPFSQYYVQNIESSLRIFHGATENLITSVNLTLVGKKTATVPFIGETGLFELDATDGYFEKKYNGLTDKLHIDICGSAHINPITIDVGASVDSSKYVLPITNSLNIEIKEGRFVATEDISLLPDVNLIIDNGAEFEISEGKAMYVYDRDEWVGKSFVFGGDLKVSPYAISRSNPNSLPRSSATLQDAEIDVNGIMRATGNIYTTASGANITSSNGTGKIHILSEGGNHELYEYRQSDSQYANIEITGMMLKNAEGSYTETATAAEGSIYDYIEGEWGLNGVARSPKADISSGTYETPQTITLKTSTSGADIYYTTDGTEPSSGSTKYTGPIEVSGEQGKEEKTVIKAITVKNGLENSPVTSLEYVIKIPHEHSWSIEWSHNGTHHWHDCTNANCSVVLESEKDKYGEHKEVIVPAVAATCTETGLTEGKKCSVCQAIIVAPTVIPALGHTVVVDAAVSATCTETGLTEGKHCSVCGETIVEQVVVAAKGHTYGEWTTEKEANCTEKGVKKNICSVCQYEDEQDIEINSDNHIWASEHTVDNEASCTEAGSKSIHCTKCDARKDIEEIAKLDHDYGEWIITKETSCTESGSKKQVCKVCSYEKDEKIPALGHTEVIDAAEPATCTETGLTEGKHCSRCGETITEQKVIAALGHIEVVDEAKEPTCTETGLTEGKHCSRCGEKLIEQKVVSAKGHIGITIPGKAATCTEKGLTDGKKCSVCGAVLEEQVEIAALGHTEVIDAAVPATCTEKGKTEGKHCSVCNEVLVAQEETEALGHDWQTDADNPKVDATCTKDGHEAGMKCSRCNAIQAGATIPAKGHTNEIIAGKAATCTETGLTEGKKCSVCGEIIDAPTVIPALGHIEVVDEAEEPTCTETGLTEGKHCSVCNTVLNTQVTVPAKGHTEVIIPGKAASCTETGLTDGKKCSVCGYVIEAQREIAALGHTELVDVAVPATCTEKGKTEGKHCSACGEVLVSQEETEALGHDWQTDADNPKVDATCTKDGHEAGMKCSRCNAIQAGATIPAKGHTNEIIAGKAATCTETGLTEGKKCSVCGEIIDAPTVIPALGHIEVVDEAEEPTCTETGLTEGKHCSVCNTVLKAQETVPAKGHTEAIIPGKAATCTETGLTKGKKCSVCGDVIEAQTEIAALGHTEVVDVAVPATCTEKGKTEGKHCSVCNEVLVAQKEIETLGHDWKTDADNPKVEATCTEDGHEAGTKCSRCNSIQAGATIPAKGHTEEIIADKAATCIETGLTEGKKCSVCGETLIVQEEIPALGHTEVVDEAKEPTCTETGLTEGKHCSVCNTVLKAQETVPAKGHTEVMIPGKAATCTGTGLTDGKKCSVCGTVLEAQTEIAALGHTEVVDAAVPATCTEKGKTEGKHCSVCGEVLVSQEDTKALGHDWKTDADNPKVEATCTEDGHEAGTKCTRCGKTQQGEIISAKGHTEETIAGKTATCTEPGLTEGKKCSVCQEIIVAPTVIPVLGHTYGEWTTVKESNCTEKGVKTRTCSVCQNVEQQDIEINHNNHIWASEYTVDKEANCTEAGSKSIHCTKCDARKESEEITKLDHNYGDWITIKEPSCIERGSKKQVCKACSYEKIADISALGHIEDIDAAVPATCTEKGKTEGKHCSVCGEVLVSQKETKALGHDWKTDEDNPRVEATCTEVGHEAGMKCIRCNEIQTGATIPAKGHTEEIIAGKTATCTEPGLTDGKKCSICQAIIVAPTVIPATGHSFENGRCKVCGEIKPGLPSGGGGGTVLPPIHDTDNEEIVVNKKNDTEQTTTAKTGARTEENKDGKLYANTDIDKEIGGEIVEKAVANNSVKIVIQAKPADNTENVSVTEVKMPVETVKAIAKETEAVLIMETQHAEVAFDNKAVETIAEQSKGDTVSILAEIIPEENRTEEQNKAAGDSGVVIELKVQHSNGTVSKFNGGKVTVTMPVPDELYGKKIKAVYVDTDGTYTVVPGKIIFRDGKEYYEFTTEHFSSYVLVEEESADTLISKQNEEFAKIEQGMKVTTIKLKSSVTAKGNIRLSWVKSKGYRVDYYQVFRSTKKGSFGKKAFYVSSDGTKTYYVNSKNLKAGKRYYYKVRGVRNINGRKYYTKWSNVSSKVAA